MKTLHHLKLLIRRLFRTDKSLNKQSIKIVRYIQTVISKDGSLKRVHHNDIVKLNTKHHKPILELTAAEKDAIMRRK